MEMATGLEARGDLDSRVDELEIGSRHIHLLQDGALDRRRCRRRWLYLSISSRQRCECNKRGTSRHSSKHVRLPTLRGRFVAYSRAVYPASSRSTTRPCASELPNVKQPPLARRPAPM